MRALLSAILACAAGACGGATAVDRVPRTLQGETRVGAFVPPFAYEAYVRGEMALARGAFDEAAAQFELATAAPEEDPFVLSRLGYAQARAGLPQESAQSLAHALRLDPCSEAVWLTRGELLELASQPEAAEQAYAKAAECAPLSPRGSVARARLLDRMGKPAEALEALTRFARAGAAGAPRLSFEIALRGEDPARLAHTLETWLAYEAPDAQSLARAVEWALARDHLGLAARMREHAQAGFPRALDARLLRALGKTEQLRRLLEETPAEALGGHQVAAELALFAQVPERAELEASAGLAQAPSDALLALRAEARWARGSSAEAIADVMAIRDPELARRTLGDLLADAGRPALAQELESLRPQERADVGAGHRARERANAPR